MNDIHKKKKKKISKIFYHEMLRAILMNYNKADVRCPDFYVHLYDMYDCTLCTLYIVHYIVHYVR